MSSSFQQNNQPRSTNSNNQRRSTTAEDRNSSRRRNRGNYRSQVNPQISNNTQQRNGHTISRPAIVSRRSRRPSEIIFCFGCYTYTLWDYDDAENIYSCHVSGCGMAMSSRKCQEMKENPCTCNPDFNGGILTTPKPYSACVRPSSSIDFDTPPEIMTLISCAICFGVADKHNHKICQNCGTLWCSHCIFYQIYDSRSLRCPSCRSDLNYDILTASPYVHVLVNYYSRKTYERVSKAYNCQDHNEESEYYCVQCEKMVCLICLESEENCIFKKHKVCKARDAPKISRELTKLFEKAFKYKRVIKSLIKEHHVKQLTIESFLEHFHQGSNNQSNNEPADPQLSSLKSRYLSLVYNTVGFSQSRLDIWVKAFIDKCDSYFDSKSIVPDSIKLNDLELVSEFAFFKTFSINQIQSETSISLFSKQVRRDLFIRIQVKFIPTESSDTYDLLYCFITNGNARNIVPKVTLWPVDKITTSEVPEIEKDNAYHKCSRIKLESPEFPFQYLMFSLALTENRDEELPESILGRLKEKINQEYKQLNQ